ncbi:hypothetical protein KFE94_15340 [bacterium SCSIO 12643]|nr:hypothetical protein KFE94_15340 [bacterium SCSIO 12643]
MRVNSIIITGPLAVGKSTIALELSERIGWGNYPVDRLKWFYRFNNGYDLVAGTRVLKEHGFGALIDYASEFFGPTELKDIFSRFHGIIDLGATDTYCCSPKRYTELKQIFDALNNVFLLLPSKNSQKSENILAKRLKIRYENHPFKEMVLQSYLDKNMEFINSFSQYLLAKHIVYLEDKTIDEICSEIIEKVKFQTPIHAI